MSDNQSNFIQLEQAADELGLSTSYLRTACRKGRFKRRIQNRHLVFDPAEITAFKDSNTYKRAKRRSASVMRRESSTTNGSIYLQAAIPPKLHARVHTLINTINDGPCHLTVSSLFEYVLEKTLPGLERRFGVANATPRTRARSNAR